MCLVRCITVKLRRLTVRALQTTIRIRFPDRTQLEKIFPSTSRIKAVYAFVRERLRDDVKPIKFILCACSSTRGVYMASWPDITTQTNLHDSI